MRCRLLTATALSAALLAASAAPAASQSLLAPPGPGDALPGPGGTTADERDRASADDDLDPSDPAYLARELDNVAAMTGRQRDQVSNPAFAAAVGIGTLDTYPANLARQLRQPTSPIVTLSQLVPAGRTADPFRIGWAEDARGVRTPFSYPNRYGATIRGSLWAPSLPFTDPVTGATTDGPLPTVVITTGSIQGLQEMYLWAAQGLAEAGYLVMTYDVQGQGTSDTFPGGGVTGCDLLGLITEGIPDTDGSDDHPCPGVPFQQRDNFVSGTEDALAWLVSEDNPLRSLVDTRRIGLAGHSLGAGAVTEVGNRDIPVPAVPDLRIQAVVGWDDANLPASVDPRVPTMGQAAEVFFTPEVRVQPPDPDAHLGTHERFVEAGVDSYHTTYASSTHLEWTYIPYILPASSTGERVAMHQTLAWFDRYLKGAPGPGTPGWAAKAQRDDATQRLTADVFDGSADRSAIGAGTFAFPAGNEPHTIEGERVADHLSYAFRSAYAFDGEVCEDVRAGC